MAKRKHVKRNPVIPCTDANQHSIESIKERARVAAAKQLKIEALREQYLSELKANRGEHEKKDTPTVISPTITPAVD